MKRALLVGIDDYDHIDGLDGCVNDVYALLPLLSRNEDDSPNFDCQIRASGTDRIDRRSLLEDVDALLAPGADVALLYFAGHGAQAKNDVVLMPQDADDGDSGVSLSNVLAKVQASPVREVLIILDCCFSGAAGGVPQFGVDAAALRSGVSILSASRGDQTAAETSEGRGLFSTYLCGALEAGAADVLGKVTMSDVYAYLSEAFGPWDQRPTFKANVDRLHELRRCSPAVPLVELRRLPEFFPEQDAELPLDSSYEPDAEPKNPEHEAIFETLQRCRAAKLVEPVRAKHMYFAAMQSSGCKLTPLGRLYWWMAKQGRL
ncbi:MAG: caspase family protein [Pyrinomonadaceae bacterium]